MCCLPTLRCSTYQASFIPQVTLGGRFWKRSKILGRFCNAHLKLIPNTSLTALFQFNFGLRGWRVKKRLTLCREDFQLRNKSFEASFQAARTQDGSCSSIGT